MGLSPLSVSGLGDQGPGGGAVSGEAGLCLDQDGLKTLGHSPTPFRGITVGWSLEPQSIQDAFSGL